MYRNGQCPIQIPLGPAVGRELRAKDLGKTGKDDGSRVQVQLRQRGFVSLCKSERGTAGCFYLQGLCGAGRYHAIAWYDVITISGAP